MKVTDKESQERITKFREALEELFRKHKMVISGGNKRKAVVEGMDDGTAFKDPEPYIQRALDSIDGLDLEYKSIEGD